MLITNSDLPALTVPELNRAYEDLVGVLADYNGIHGDRLHARLQAIRDQLRARALMEDVARGLTDEKLARCIEIIDDLDWDETLSSVQAASLAILRDEQTRRAA